MPFLMQQVQRLEPSGVTDRAVCVVTISRRVRMTYRRREPGEQTHCRSFGGVCMGHTGERWIWRSGWAFLWTIQWESRVNRIFLRVSILGNPWTDEEQSGRSGILSFDVRWFPLSPSRSRPYLPGVPQRTSVCSPATAASSS